MPADVTIPATEKLSVAGLMRQICEQAIADVVTAEEVGEVLRGLLRANMSFTECTSRTEKRVVERPDWRVRFQAIQLLLAYALGRPVERQEIRQETLTAAIGVEEAALKSPAYRATLRDMLARIEADASNGRLIESETPQDVVVPPNNSEELQTGIHNSLENQ